MKNVGEVLLPLATAWKEAEAGVDWDTPVPPGDYQAIVYKFDTFEGKDNLFLKTVLQIASGEYAGAQVETVHALDIEERLPWLKKHVNALGLDSESFEYEDLLSVLAGVLDNVVEIAVVQSKKINPSTNEPYVNVYVNRPIVMATLNTEFPPADDIEF